MAEDLELISFDRDRLVGLIETSLARNSFLDERLGAIEEHLLSSNALRQIEGDRQALIEVYKAIEGRRSNSLNFVIKLLDLGVKTKVLRPPQKVNTSGSDRDHSASSSSRGRIPHQQMILLFHLHRKISLSSQGDL